MSFINFTNHPSDHWDERQKRASEAYGKIIDIPFPNVDPKASEEEIVSLGDEYIKRILEKQPTCVLIQGEFTLCFYMISKLIKKGIKVVSACSVRNIIEKDGVKISRFEFVKYREYKI